MMKMESNFIQSLQNRATTHRGRIGIGIWNANPDLLESLRSASRFADLLLVGNLEARNLESKCPHQFIQSKEPWKDLVRLLAEGAIDGAVRGNLPAGRTMKALAEQFEIKIRRLALVELSGWSFLLGPVGIAEGDTVSDRLELVNGATRFLQRFGVSPKVSILSGGRLEDISRSSRVDRSLADGELIAAQARFAGIKICHRGILIENCMGDDIIIAPDGISGNLIFRTLLLLCGANSLGAPVLMDKIFIDSTRARGNFDGPVMLASSMVKLKDRTTSIE